MPSRRRFLANGLATGVAALAAPTLAAAQVKEFELAEPLRPRYVRTADEITPGQIIVMPQKHFLYWVVEQNKAIRYGVGVGRAGLSFQGKAVVGRKAEWPSWRPTAAMIERNPQQYPKFVGDDDYIMPGGPGNPLGARALYLFKDGRDTYYRIHGTTQPESIGRSDSSGCIRMLNSHVKHLYDQVPVGTPVTVV
ncbi:L,D-transpeptidase [Anianabacter salinae]|uniref:L,D-transpeptidase n=1 Tax=Anianabacter salinae TaxID=2851023 RepID=UPI00225E2D98|nr:L,D-transpeptidase [Anianabacter salinae]MBV0911001.1 L,D-transpeptidase [Anianabacter salinae]